MKTYDVPEWIICPLVKEGVSESDYHLYGAGRALGFIRMAADALDDSRDCTELKVAEYHAYVSISAARTAIDATASWLNVKLQLGLKPSPQINLSKGGFRAKVSKVRPEVQEYIQVLGDLGKQVDEHRQRAQHREGLALLSHSDSKELGHRVGWYLMPKGLSGNRTADLHLAELLRCWADNIEINLREIHQHLT